MKQLTACLLGYNHHYIWRIWICCQNLLGGALWFGRKENTLKAKSTIIICILVVVQVSQTTPIGNTLQLSNTLDQFRSKSQRLVYYRWVCITGTYGCGLSITHRHKHTCMYMYQGRDQWGTYQSVFKNTDSLEPSMADRLHSHSRAEDDHHRVHSTLQEHTRHTHTHTHTQTD